VKIYSALLSILCLLSIGASLEGSPGSAKVPVIIHRRIGSTPCELVQHGSLVTQKQRQFVWIEIEGLNGEIYSPELGPDDYLTPTLSVPGAIAKAARKSGFELKASSTTISDVPGVAALGGGGNCPDVPSAIAETERQRTSRRDQLQSKTYVPGSEGVIPVHVSNAAPNPEQAPVDPAKNGTGTQSKAKKLQGTVILAVIIGIDGTIQRVRVMQSVSPEFDQKATEVISRWTYDPGRMKGLPVPTETMVEVAFHLY
jgi:TonB family protein